MEKTRLCKNEKCGKPLEMKQNETWARFAQRMYCDSTCWRQQKSLMEKQRRKEAKQGRLKRDKMPLPVESAPVVATVRRCNPNLLMARMLRGSVWDSNNG